MAKKRMFKTLSITKLENLGATGGWASVGVFQKQQAMFKSAYVDKVKISFILEGDTSGSSSKQLGYLWAVSTKQSLSATDADNSGYIVGASASRGGGGVVTIPIQRRIVDNDFEDTSGQNALALFCRMTDTGSEDYSITMVIETYGRFLGFTPN